MLHHRTNDPAQRAASIADREAEEVWRETHNFDLYYETWAEIYHQVLFEFCHNG